MRPAELEALRILTMGENPLDRARLDEKLHAATRGLFSKPGWFGAFDNCLWDIAGKAANLPVCDLIGRARASAPCYYNFHSHGPVERAIEDGEAAVASGFPALKDHFTGSAGENIALFRAVRAAFGAEIELLHDAAGCHYSLYEALRVGHVLEELGFGWFEEPLPDRQQGQLRQVCAALDIPVLAPEALMHDRDLSAQWLISGATDLLRANARHGVTQTLKLANLAEMHGTTIELNGPGGLFGLVHAHLACALSNSSYYEYFPGGTRDEVGKEIGLTNPPLPKAGFIAPPDGPGWGAEWDWDRFATAVVHSL